MFKIGIVTFYFIFGRDSLVELRIDTNLRRKTEKRYIFSSRRVEWYCKISQRKLTAGSADYNTNRPWSSMVWFLICETSSLNNCRCMVCLIANLSAILRVTGLYPSLHTNLYLSYVLTYLSHA